MDCQRNRIEELSEYLASLGITVNIGKTKARGNKGVFLYGSSGCRIDVAKNTTEKEQLSVILHEFAHYVHFCYDKSLNSLDFIFNNYTNQIDEELVAVTVASVPKDAAAKFFNQKHDFKNKIKELSLIIKRKYPDYKISESYKPIERKLNMSFLYLLRYDKVKIWNTVYSIDNIDKYSELDTCTVAYLKLKHYQRLVKKINAKISRLNRYYNNKSELFARFIELYFIDRELLLKTAPIATNKMDDVIRNGVIKEFSDIYKILYKIN